MSHALTLPKRRSLAVLSALAVLFASLLLIPTSAYAQGFTVEVGSATIEEPNGGTATVPITVNPGGTNLAGLIFTVGYDSSLIQVTSCVTEPGVQAACNDGPAEVAVDAVNADGWNDEFVVASLTFRATGGESTVGLDVTVVSAVDVDRNPLSGQGIGGSITVGGIDPPTVMVSSSCENDDGRFDFVLTNPSDAAINFTITVGGESANSTVGAGGSTTQTINGVDDGAFVAVSVVADGDFGEIFAANEAVRCDPEVSPSLTCTGTSATLTIEIVNYSGSFATYVVTVDGDTQSFSVADGRRATRTFSGLDDGARSVSVRRNGIEIYDAPVNVECGGPPAPGPEIPGAASPNEVTTAVTCLAENGRVDTNIVNLGSSAAAYRIEFEGLTPRQSTVIAGDWWRMPITGRPDGSYGVVITRDGVVVSDTAVTVSCDTEPPQVDTPEVQVVNACRAGNGYILFQFANNTDAQRGYVIEFEGVSNRSTSAAAYGGAVRAVTGRPDGSYSVLIRLGDVPLVSFEVVVDCL